MGFCYDELNSSRPESRDKLTHLLCRCDIHAWNCPCVENHLPNRLTFLCDERFNPLDEEPHVGEDQRSIEAIRHQSWQSLSCFVVTNIMHRGRAFDSTKQRVLWAHDLRQHTK